MMKVMQLLPALGVGGVERGTVELSRQLSQSGIRSVVLAKGGELAGEIKHGGGEWIPFDCAAKNPLTAPMRVWQLRRLLISEKPDIAHARSRVPAWLLFFARRGLPLRTVTTMHGMHSPGIYSGIMTRADAVICPSRAVLANARDDFRAPEDKLHLIHRGVDFDYFHPDKIDRAFCEEFRARYRLHNARVALLAARLTRLKGHDVFLRALAGCENTVGLIVGGGSESRKRALLDLARQLGIADRLRFAGAQKNMREIYALADATVSASVRPEAFGRTVAESLAMGTPAAAPAFGGAMDIIREGENGFLFAPGDSVSLCKAMQKALAMRGENLRKNLRQSVLPMSLTAMCEKTMTVYRSLCAQPPPQP